MHESLDYWFLLAHCVTMFQECGRAGRDGQRSSCVLYYSYSDYVSCSSKTNVYLVLVSSVFGQWACIGTWMASRSNDMSSHNVLSPWLCGGGWCGQFKTCLGCWVNMSSNKWKNRKKQKEEFAFDSSIMLKQ